MPITFQCPCGESLAAEDEHAGLMVECPTCQKRLAVPALEPIFEPDDPPAKPPAPPPPKKKARVVDDERPRKRKKRRRNDDDDDENPHVRAIMRKANAELDEEEDRHRRQGGGVSFTPGILLGLGLFALGGLGALLMICFGVFSIRLIVFCLALAIGGLVRAILSYNGQGFD